MSIAYDGGQKVHSGGGATRRDDTPRDWTPDERAAHAKNTASNVTRAAAEVAAACARMQAATEFTEQAAAKKEAGLALESLRAAATAAVAAISQATDPEVVVVLQGAETQLKAADAEVKALPEPIATSPREVTGVRRFATALPPADGPGRQDSPRMVAQLRGIIASELVHGDLDPLKAALAEGGELWPQFSRLAMQLRADLLGKLDTERPRLLTERIDRETAAKRRSVASTPVEAVAAHDGPAAANSPGADVHDPLHALAATASAQLGIAPRLEVGEAGRAATEARGARGVAHGDAIAIHPDVDTTTAAGKQVVFHEYFHQAQSQLPGASPDNRPAAEVEATTAARQFAATGAAAVPQVPIDLAQPAADKDAERDVAADRVAESNIAQAVLANRPVTAQDYLRGHLIEHVLPAITRRVSAKRYPLPERARWNAHAHPFGVDVMAQVRETFETDPYFGLPAMLAHASPDLWSIIDTHRGMQSAKTFGEAMPARNAVGEAGATGIGARGSAGWNPTIGDLIAKAFDEQLAAAVLELGRRYVAAYDAHAADAEASHGTRARHEVGYPDMYPGNAIERVVGHTLADGHITVDAAVAGAPTAAPATKELTLAAAAERVIEQADATYAALDRARGNPTPPPQLAALEDALRDLADVLHHRSGKQRDSEAATLTRAQQKAEQVLHQLASKLGPRSPAQTALRQRMNLVWNVADDNRADDVPSDPAELATIAHENLAQLEEVRTMIEAAQARTADVSVVELMPAITTTRSWVTQLGDGSDRGAAAQLARAIHDQEDLVMTVDVELREVFREPITQSWGATVNAYASVLGRSTEPRQRVAAALEHARRMRRRLKLDQVQAALIDGRDQAATLNDLDGAKGDQAGGTQALLAAKAEAYEAKIAAGGTVPASELDELLLLARERAFANRLEVLRQMAAQTRSAVSHLRDGNPLKPLAVRLIERKILDGLVPKLDRLVADIDETRHTYEAWAQPNATDIPPSQHRARRRDAVAGMEVRLQETLAKGRYQDILEEARLKLSDATNVEIGSVLIETIAMTMVGNFAGMAARGGAEGLVLGRAAANAERTAAAMEAAGAAEAAIEAQEAATLVRTGATASRLGAVAGHVAEGVFNSLTQKYLQGDESSLASLVFVNVGTSAALEKLIGSLQSLRHPEEAVDGVLKKLPRDIKAAQAGVWLAKAGATLTAEVVAGAAVDYALSRLAGRKTNPPSDQTVAEWLMQGGMQAVGKHISHNVGAVKHSLEQLHLATSERGGQLAAYADGLAVEARLLEKGKGGGGAADVLERYNELLRRHAELLDRQLMAAVEAGDDVRRKQVLTMVRANNREATALRDLATDSFEGGGEGKHASKRRPDGDSAPRGGDDQPSDVTRRVPQAPDSTALPTPVDEPTAAPAKVTTELPIHERPTGRMDAVAPPPDLAAADGHVAPHARPPETLPALQQIEAVTGVTKGPQYDQGMADLRQFYADMEAAAQHRTPVRNTRKDGGYEWDYGHDSQTFSHGLVNVEFRVHLVRGRGVSDAELAKLQANVHAGVDKHYNLPSKQVTPRGGTPHRLHVEVVFVDDPARAHIIVSARAGDGQADATTWFVDGDPTTHAHEVGHGAFGLKDEYVDPKLQAPDRLFPNSPGVTNDGSLMGDYWQRDSSGNLVPRPSTELKERHLDIIGDQARPAPPTSVREGQPAQGQDSTDNRTLREYLANLGRSGRAPPRAPADLDHVPALGSFHGHSRAEGSPDLSEREVRTQLVNEVASIAPTSARLASDHELILNPDSDKQIAIAIRVHPVPADAVARHIPIGDGSFEIHVSPRARTGDVVRALASEVATIDSVSRTGRQDAPPVGLEGRVAELRVLVENLDRSRARGGEHLDVTQVEHDLTDLLDSLGISRTPVGLARLASLTGSDGSLHRRLAMHLDGMPLRPTLDASSDLGGFSDLRRSRLDGLRTHARGDNVEQLVAAEELALGTQLRLEEGHRIFDGLNAVARPKPTPATQAAFNRQREAFTQILNDSTLTLKARKTMLKAQVGKFLADPGLSEVVHKARTADVNAAIDALGDTDAVHGSMHLDVSTGRLVVHGDTEQGPRSIRELTTQVDQANQAAAKNGIAIEYVVIIHRPNRGLNGEELSMVEVAARRRPRSRLPSDATPLLESPAAGDLIVDIGVGRGSFAAELAARNPGDQIIQTELIDNAEIGQMSRETPGIADAGPLQRPGATMVFADILTRPELLRPGAVDAGAAGTKLVLLNNVSAHLSPREYTDLARALMTNLADDGSVEVQWTMSPEGPGKPEGSRGHIDDHLLDALRDVQAEFGRSIDVAVLKPVPYNYTLNASVRGQADSESLNKFDPPRPEHRIRITLGKRKRKGKQASSGE